MFFEKKLSTCPKKIFYFPFIFEKHVTISFIPTPLSLLMCGILLKAPARATNNSMCLPRYELAIRAHFGRLDVRPYDVRYR